MHPIPNIYREYDKQIRISERYLHRSEKKLPLSKKLKKRLLKKPLHIEKDILKIEFPVSEVRDKAIRKTKQTTDAVTFTYHALINYTSAGFLPLQTDSLPIVFGEVEAEMNTDSRKKDAINWMMRKAFEDFIIALTESLIEAYTFLKLRAFADESKKHTTLGLEQTEKNITLIKEKSRKMSFPDLICEII